MMKEYSETFIEKPSYKFPNGEVFLGIGSVDSESHLVNWQLPKIILNALNSEKNHVTDPLDKVYRNAIHETCENIIALPPHTVHSDVSIYFRSPEKILEIKQDVIFNKEYKGPKLKGLHIDQFYDENQMCTAVIKNRTIVSIAFDNGNGALTAETAVVFRNQGFCKACIQRLSNEYHKKGQRCDIGTTIGNDAAIKAARSSGFLESAEKGIWLRISPGNAKKHKSLLEGLFQ